MSDEPQHTDPNAGPSAPAPHPTLRQLASPASSALLQRDSGIPVSAGRVQASAVIAAVCTTMNRRGRSLRG